MTPKHLINGAENVAPDNPPITPAQAQADFTVLCGNDALGAWVYQDIMANRGRGVSALL